MILKPVKHSILSALAPIDPEIVKEEEGWAMLGEVGQERFLDKPPLQVLEKFVYYR